MIQTKELTPFEYHMQLGWKPEEHTFEITDELIDRLKFNTGYKVTPSSQKVIKYGVEQFTLVKHPNQIGYAIEELTNVPVWNVAMNAMEIHLKYLICWRYFFRLIAKHRSHHFTDLFKLAGDGNRDVGNVFTKDIAKIGSHKDFIAFMWKVRTTLDFDEMCDLNDCMTYWNKYHESKNDWIIDQGIKDAFKPKRKEPVIDEAD